MGPPYGPVATASFSARFRTDQPVYPDEGIRNVPHRVATLLDRCIEVLGDAVVAAHRLDEEVTIWFEDIRRTASHRRAWSTG
jgi:hypothetical protein